MISKFKLHFDFFEVRAKLTGKFNDTSAQQLMTEKIKSNPDLIVFNFKYFSAPEREILN